MGFDKDDTKPVVDVKRRTTKVNISVVVAVVIFFAIGGIILWALAGDPSSATSEAVPLP